MINNANFIMALKLIGLPELILALFRIFSNNYNNLVFLMI